MAVLDGRAVLLVEDDEDSRMLLEEGIEHHGAQVRSAESGEHALSILEVWRPDILVTDLNLPGMDGTTLLGLARARPTLGELPAIALTGHGDQAHREAAFRAGFAKHLLKPTKLADLVLSIVALDQRTSGAPTNLRELLRRVNLASPCRFTSLLRFAEDGTLVSAWTFDRENPGIDPFPLGMSIEASYCVLVRAQGTTCVIEDASIDLRTIGHPKRTELATYVGAPLFGTDGRMVGTLCNYDPRPLTLGTEVRRSIEAATRGLETVLSSVFAPH